MENSLGLGVLPKPRSTACAALHRHGQQPWLIMPTDWFGHYLTVSLLTGKGGCGWCPAHSDSCCCDVLDAFYILILLFLCRPVLFKEMRVMRVCFCLPSSPPAPSHFSIPWPAWICSWEEGSEVMNLWKCCSSQWWSRDAAQVIITSKNTRKICSQVKNREIIIPFCWYHMGY